MYIVILFIGNVFIKYDNIIYLPNTQVKIILVTIRKYLGTVNINYLNTFSMIQL